MGDFGKWVKRAKRQISGIRFITDVHEIPDVYNLSNILVTTRDVVQVPAFLSRQTDLLTECGRIFRTVNVKRGQFMSPRSASYISEKVKLENCTTKVWLTERGSTFGYETLLVDFGAVDELSPHFDKLILDVTHSTQRQSMQDTTTGSRKLGKRKRFPPP